MNEVFEKYREKRKDKTNELKYNPKTQESEEMITFGQHVNKAWKNIYEKNRIKR